MFVTIIIPTYNDWDRLRLCLKALEDQSYPQRDFEVIVVNNNSNDLAPKDLVLATNCRIIMEPKAGSYAARNAALKIAHGNIIGFTDSDCIPDRDWIANAVEHFRTSTIPRIAGKIELFFKGTELTSTELFEKVYAFRQARNAKMGGSVTGNMFTTKKVFDQVGLFNQSLFSGGDMEWGRRANSAGFEIVFKEDVLVKHPARHEFKDLIKKTKRINGVKRNKVKSVLYFLYHSTPPLSTLRDGKNLSVKEKIRIFLIMYQLKFIGITEQLKVSFGKTPQRE